MILPSETLSYKPTTPKTDLSRIVPPPLLSLLHPIHHFLVF